MHIAMIGAGYVGLVSATCFADFGHDVVCVDKDPNRLNTLRGGKIPIYEPGLEELVKSNAEAGRLHFSDDVGSATGRADIVFLAVGTPSRHGDGYADLTFVYEAAREIAPHLSDFTVVVTKSTVPVGTGDEVERIIRDVNPAAQCAVVSNPEFLREGSAIEDFKKPDRIIIGTDDQRAQSIMEEVYGPLCANEAPILFTGRRTAELTKYASNAFLAMKITFINEMADLCERVGADVLSVARGMGMDARIGDRFLQAGPGYGGSCFPKDSTALTNMAQDSDSPLRLVETTVAINDQRRRAMARKVIRACGGRVRGRRIGILGLTFKPDTDDMREAPSIPIIRTLLDAGAIIRAYDPAAVAGANNTLREIEICPDPYAAAEGAAALAVITDWDEFSSLDLDRLRRQMDPASTVLVDLRNMFDPARITGAGFVYEAVGRGDLIGTGATVKHAAE
ncbi:UDP-glucose dehydrogenase family protein [Hoeflea poritis]|uniref:UDP-glucose 6-dehydrogenase n=1 Tax=Hoeflea poritis TaxID=2993659 RepID=A0ABT4VIA7_9HYPH|nr:UDP-glucose/GDP-mannose dehydrogenase family protein [Hoeflea poritis]MDA4844421.1 UDP-glucose/GDP-mannose dehydrogenase family protein [Hoeflea poritis]